MHEVPAIKCCDVYNQLSDDQGNTHTKDGKMSILNLGVGRDTGTPYFHFPVV